MIRVPENIDQVLIKRLEHLTKNNSDYWSFRRNSRRDLGHGFFQYPAMMVPQMVRSILDEVCAVHKNVEWVSDPFVGSGTILTECMLRGQNFWGSDINPLALLLCRVKSGPFFPKALKVKTQILFDRVRNDTCSRITIDFPGRDKWFRQDVQIALSSIRHSILLEKSELVLCIHIGKFVSVESTYVEDIVISL